MLRRTGLIAFVAVLLTSPAASTAQEAPRYAGATKTGFLLPNGWTVSPVGEQVPVADLPLNILPLPDSRHVLVATSGYNAHELSLINLETKAVVDRQAVRESWFGLAASSRFDRIWWSGAGSNFVHRLDLQGTKLGHLEIDPRGEGRGGRSGARATFAADWPSILKARCSTRSISTTEPSRRSIRRPARSSSQPRSAAGPMTWRWPAAATSFMFQTGPGGRFTSSTRPTCELPRGSPWASIPTSLPSTPRTTGCSSPAPRVTSIAVIDTRRGIVTETIHTALFPQAPEGSTPDALAIAPDGKTLFVANADNNCVAVIDIGSPSKSCVKGFIPTGWYPTAVAVTPDGKNLLDRRRQGEPDKAKPHQRRLDQAPDRI